MTKPYMNPTFTTVSLILTSIIIILTIFGFIMTGNARTAVNETKIEQIELIQSKSEIKRDFIENKLYSIDKKLDILIESLKE